jgi:hypothetical protein
MTAEHATPHHPGDVEGETHGIGDHGEAEGSEDHGHASEEPLGPIDLVAWGSFALGIGLGLAVALCIALATGDFPA